MNLRIPDAEEEGWVTVKVNGKSDRTGKSSYLGQTEIYYFNERRVLLKQIVQEEEQRYTFFETWKTACKGYSTDSKEKETKFRGSGKHEIQVDVFHQSQVNIEFVIKTHKRLTKRLLEFI